MDKKGEMSIGIIVTAVLALLVLVILAIIIGMKTGLFSAGVSDCEGAMNGKCVAKGDSCPAGSRQLLTASCGKQSANPDRKCCKSLEEP